MTLPTPPPPVPDLREKIAKHLHFKLLRRPSEPLFDDLGIWHKDFLFIKADEILALLPPPSPAVPDALTWTREKPKVEGWYWLALGDAPEVVHVRFDPVLNRLEFFDTVYGSDSHFEITDQLFEEAQWAGPLPEPRDPSQAPAPAEKGGAA